jgi:hypothetical protein
MDTAAVKHCEICEINRPVLIQVQPGTVIRPTAIGCQPIRRQIGQVFELVIDYLDPVLAPEGPSGGEGPLDDDVRVDRPEPAEIAAAKVRLYFDAVSFINENIHALALELKRLNDIQ